MPSRRLREGWDDRRFRQAPATLDPVMPPTQYYSLSTSEDENQPPMRPAFPHSKQCQIEQTEELSASVSEHQDASAAENEDRLSTARGICFGFLLAFGFWAFVGLVLWILWWHSS